MSTQKLPRDAQGYVKTFLPNQADEIHSFFERYGVVVVQDVLDATDIEHSIDAIWSSPELESRGVKRDDPETWDRCWPCDGKIERKGWIESWRIFDSAKSWPKLQQHRRFLGR